MLYYELFCGIPLTYTCFISYGLSVSKIIVILCFQAQNNRQANTQGGGQSCHPTRYYGNPS